MNSWRNKPSFEKYGVYFRDKTIYSFAPDPYTNRFTQADSLIPGAGNPQAWNRYAYVLNNPLKYNDPSGHEPKGPGSCYDYVNGKCGHLVFGENTPSLKRTTSKNNNPCLEGACSTLLRIGNSECSSADCQFAATTIGMLATAYDTGALVMNASFAIAADLLFITQGVPGYGTALTLYRPYSVIPNSMAVSGGFLWTLQGFIIGDNFVELQVTNTPELSDAAFVLSAAISQDTLVSLALDSFGLTIQDPNVATLWSLNGVGYDLLRNPLSPALSNTAPPFPTLINPNATLVIDLASKSLNFEIKLSR